MVSKLTRARKLKPKPKKKPSRSKLVKTQGVKSLVGTVSVWADVKILKIDGQW